MTRADTDWRSYDLEVGMPHMEPGRLSEVELLKHLGNCQWQTIAALLERPTCQIVNDLGERLYASFVSLEWSVGRGRCMENLGEGLNLGVRNKVAFYAGKFVDGLVLFGGDPLSEEDLSAVQGPEDLMRREDPWAYLTNAFIAPMGSNQRLKVFAPTEMDSCEVPTISERPQGIDQHEDVQLTGVIPAFGDGAGLPLTPTRRDPIVYPIVPESDLNGAGLLYFARYVAMMNYGERQFLSQRLERPLSEPLLTCLSPIRRRVYYYANAVPSDTVRVDVSSQVTPVAAEHWADLGPVHQVPFRLQSRVDLYRSSDQTLMASSLVEKQLVVPGREKRLLAEAQRFLHQLQL